jgi:hypothetical protein
MESAKAPDPERDGEARSGMDVSGQMKVPCIFSEDRPHEKLDVPDLASGTD